MPNIQPRLTDEENMIHIYKHLLLARAFASFYSPELRQLLENANKSICLEFSSPRLTKPSQGHVATATLRNTRNC